MKRVESQFTRAALASGRLCVAGVLLCQPPGYMALEDYATPAQAGFRRQPAVPLQLVHFIRECIIDLKTFPIAASRQSKLLFNYCRCCQTRGDGP